MIGEGQAYRTPARYACPYLHLQEVIVSVKWIVKQDERDTAKTSVFVDTGKPYGEVYVGALYLHPDHAADLKERLEN